MNDIIKSLGYFDRAINKALPKRIQVIDLSTTQYVEVRKAPLYVIETS